MLFISIIFHFVQQRLALGTMPKVKTNRVKIPEGWELIEPTLLELQAKMREGSSNFIDNNLFSFFASFWL